MDTILCPREPTQPELEAGSIHPPSSLRKTTHDAESSEIPETAPKLEGMNPPYHGIRECGIRECQCFPDGETKEQCQERFKAIVEEQKKLYGINKICGKLN